MKLQNSTNRSNLAVAAMDRTGTVRIRLLAGLFVALFLIGLPEILREFAEYRMLLYGAALVIMMLVRPEGLVPEARRKLEMHEVEAGAGE